MDMYSPDTPESHAAPKANTLTLLVNFEALMLLLIGN